MKNMQTIRSTVENEDMTVTQKSKTIVIDKPI